MSMSKLEVGQRVFYVGDSDVLVGTVTLAWCGVETLCYRVTWDDESFGEFRFRPGVPSMYNARIHPYTEEAYLEAKNQKAASNRLYEFHRFGSDTFCDAELLEESCKRQC